jgi:diacylglycerol kinase (ATP)
MTAKVILNPYANRWNAQKRWREAESALRAAGVDFDLAVSAGPHDIARLAVEAAADGFSPLIAAGGDGTIGEMVNALAQTAAEGAGLPLVGLLPLGTANDLAYALKIPFDLRAAAQVIAAGKIRRVDLGKVNELYFVNNSALCLEPYVSVIQNKIGWIKGTARYLVAAVRGILDQPAWTARLEWEGGSFEGPLTLLYIGNGSRSGGVFYMSPHADPFDGQLTVVFGYRDTRRGMFALLPNAMRPGAGSYVESPGVREFPVRWLKVHLNQPSPAHTDGEIFTTAITDLEYRVFPGRIQFLLP